MAVMIKGIKVDSISIGKEAETGMPTISGSYSLISSADVVLAKQDFNSYSSSIKITPVGKTAEALHALVNGIKNDLESILGLKEVS